MTGPTSYALCCQKISSRKLALAYIEQEHGTQESPDCHHLRFFSGLLCEVLMRSAVTLKGSLGAIGKLLCSCLHPMRWACIRATTLSK